jgi:hypothetical protein
VAAQAAAAKVARRRPQEYASDVEWLADYLRQGKISRESLTEQYADDMRYILMWPNDSLRYQERQERRLEAIRLSGVEPLPQILLMWDGNVRLVLDQDEHAGVLAKARVEWAGKGYRVEESPMPFGWTRIDVTTKEHNPGGGKRSSGIALLKPAKRSSWPVGKALDEAYKAGLHYGDTGAFGDWLEKTGLAGRGLLLRSRLEREFRRAVEGEPERTVGYKGATISLLPDGDWSVSIEPESRFDGLKEAKQFVDKALRGKNPLDMATIVGVGAPAGATQAVVQPWVTRHVYGAGSGTAGVAGNPATTYLGWPVVVIGSHRSWDKVLDQVGEDNLIELYTHDRQRSAGTGYAAIRPSKLSVALVVKAVSRASFRGGVSLHPGSEHTGRDPWPLAWEVAEEYRAAGGVAPWAAYDAGRPAGNPAPGQPTQERRYDQLRVGDYIRVNTPRQSAYGTVSRVLRTNYEVTADHYGHAVVYKLAKTDLIGATGMTPQGEWFSINRLLVDMERERAGNPGSEPRFYVREDDWPLQQARQWWCVYDSVTGEKMNVKGRGERPVYGSERLAQRAADKLNKDWAAGKIEVVAEGKSNPAMKRYVMSFAAANEHTPEHPDRTARRDLGWDVQFQVWPNRSSMAHSIRMQEKREHRQDDWHAVVKLRETEGY